MKPKVKFKIEKLEEYLPILKEFILGLDSWRDKIFSIYPSLKKRLENSKNPEKEIESFFMKQEKKFDLVFEKVKKDFQSSWNKNNNELMDALAQINEISWPEKMQEFKARITLNPICPRYLDSNTFDLYFGLADRTMKTIVLHELSHFIFFEKIKEIYPDINEKEFEAPNLIWKLSEIIPWVVLNDERIRKILDLQDSAIVYEDIQKLEINGKRILKIFEEFYDSKKDFSDFLVKSLDFVKEHEKQIVCVKNI